MAQDSHHSSDGIALLLVDLQDRFLAAVSRPETVVKRCLFAAKAARLLGMPVLLSAQLPGKLGPVRSDIVDASGSNRVFEKAFFSAWQAPGFYECMEEFEVTHLLVGGIETPICVYQTVLDAVRASLGVTLLTDCVDAGRPEDAAAVLAALGAHNEVSLVPAEAVFYSLLASAEHPAFRDFTKLVKEHR